MSNQEMQNQAPELELNEILKVRREKLAELQQNGMDPFEITKFDRSHTSSQIKDNYTEEERYTLPIWKVRFRFLLRKIFLAKMNTIASKSLT